MITEDDIVFLAQTHHNERTYNADGTGTQTDTRTTYLDDGTTLDPPQVNTTHFTICSLSFDNDVRQPPFLGTFGVDDAVAVVTITAVAPDTVIDDEFKWVHQ